MALQYFNIQIKTQKETFRVGPKLEFVSVDFDFPTSADPFFMAILSRGNGSMVFIRDTEITLSKEN